MSEGRLTEKERAGANEKTRCLILHAASYRTFGASAAGPQPGENEAVGMLRFGPRKGPIGG